MATKKEDVDVTVPVPFEVPFEVPVRLERGGVLPARAHADDAGFDLRAVLPETGMVIGRGGLSVVSTSVSTAIPEGLVGLVMPRSGLAFRDGITLVNSPGVIDAGYRGEIRLLLINHGPKPVHIRPGDRLAQLVFVRMAPVELVQVDELPDGSRGTNGFGSTGRQ